MVIDANLFFMLKQESRENWINRGTETIRSEWVNGRIVRVRLIMVTLSWCSLLVLKKTSTVSMFLLNVILYCC